MRRRVQHLRALDLFLVGVFQMLSLFSMFIDNIRRIAKLSCSLAQKAIKELHSTQHKNMPLSLVS